MVGASVEARTHGLRVSCAPAAVAIETISANNLCKTGIPADRAGDFERFAPRDAVTGRPETKSITRKAGISGHFSGLLGNLANARVRGWRRSADRTRLHANSLLTGNFTGKIAVSGLLRPISWQEAAVPQRLLAQFPTQINRENISKNREFFAVKREFYLRKSLSGARSHS